MKFLPDTKGRVEPFSGSDAEQPQLTTAYPEAPPLIDFDAKHGDGMQRIDWDRKYPGPGIDWDRKYAGEPLLPITPPVLQSVDPKATEYLDHSEAATWWPAASIDINHGHEPVTVAEPDPVRKTFRRRIRRSNTWQAIKAKVIPGKTPHFKYDTDERYEAFKRSQEVKPPGVLRRLGNVVVGIAERAPSATREKVGNFVLHASHEIAQRTDELLARKELQNSIVLGALAMTVVTVASNFLQQKGVSAAGLISPSGPRGGSSELSNALHFWPSKGSSHHVTNYLSHLPHPPLVAPPINFEIHPGGNLSQSVHDTVLFMGAKDPDGATTRIVNYLQFQQGSSLNIVHSGDNFSLPLSTVQQLIG